MRNQILWASSGDARAASPAVARLGVNRTGMFLMAATKFEPSRFDQAGQFEVWNLFGLKPDQLDRALFHAPDRRGDG
jgi:hypothetical protein